MILLENGRAKIGLVITTCLPELGVETLDFYVILQLFFEFRLRRQRLFLRLRQRRQKREGRRR